MLVTISEERDIRVLVAIAVRAARRAERDGYLPWGTPPDWLTGPLLRLEAELRFAPWDDFHCLLRRAVSIAFDFLDRKYKCCPMKYVVMVERELTN